MEKTLRQQYKQIYWCWKAIKQRCQNPNCKAYKNYGARGISVCNEWQTFEPFCEWALSSGYENGKDIDRIDNDKGYSQNNCRWIDRRANINNRRMTIILECNGKKMPRTKWEEELNLPRGILKAWFETHGKEYTEKRLSEICENGYEEKNYSYSHTKRVLHQESGIWFESVKAAAKYFEIAPCTISNAIRENRATSKGRFEYKII